MTREEYLKNKDLIEKWADGASIETSYENEEDWFVIPDPNWNENYKYRLKKFTPKQGETILV